MRVLSDGFMSDLKDEGGILRPLLERVRGDEALMLAIRDEYINIYYRGGNLLRVRRLLPGRYEAWFDVRYNKSGRALSLPEAVITSVHTGAAWADRFPELKSIMDHSMLRNRKPEREFQQLIVRQNNRSPISNASEYFISDIEYSDPTGRERTDMLAVRWLSGRPRTNGASCRAALIELKFGDTALGGPSGLLSHLRNMDALVSDCSRYKSVLRTIESQFAQLDELGLLSYTHAKVPTKVRLDPKAKPEVVLILANHNPKSGKLHQILSDPAVAEYARAAHYDLRFFVASFCGYGMYSATMYDLDAFRKLVRLQLE